MTSPRHIYIIYLTLAALATLTFCSCRSTQNIIYLSDAQRDSATAILTNYSALAMPGDQLNIDIVSQSPESLYQFYERINTGNQNNIKEQNLRQSYIVSPAGEIDLPLLGKIPVASLPLDTIASQIQQQLKQNNLVSDPIVTVTRTNFRVTVTGEVANPSTLNIQGNRLTIFEALAQTGDITLSGQRNNIKVMREQNGQQTIGEIDLTSKTVLDSPYYYLQQNDIVYVEPDKKKKRIATTDPNTTSYISMSLSVIRLVSSIYLYNATIQTYR